MRLRIALVALACLGAGFRATQAASGAVATLGRIGQAVYWPSGMTRPVEQEAYVPPAEADPPGFVFGNLARAEGRTAYQWDYGLKVSRRAYRLRVAVDGPSAFEWHYLVLQSPVGERYEAPGFNSTELVAPNPPTGVWRVIVYSKTNVPDFRFRARLESAPGRTRGKRALFPNLKLIPPFEFTFANPYRGTLRNELGPAPVPHATANCWWDEVAEHAARKCLRFSIGPINAGEGDLDLRFEGNGTGIVAPGRVTQVIHHTDGSVVERYAGASEFHKTHMHYHHTGFGVLELFKVTDARRGRMEPAGVGPKQGFCTADIVLYEWTRFAGTQNQARSECLNDMQQLGTYAPTGTQMGISPGWADIYDWSQSGNYVEFGANGDGRYVVRSTADAAGYVAESNERDNTSYAYIEITGTTINVLERGFGAHPWDRRKQPARDILRPVPSGFAS